MPKDTFLRLKDEKRKKIENGLILTFRDKGYDSASVNDLIAVSGIPRGSFYQYFIDKYDAFMYIIERAQQTKMTYMEALIKRIGDEPFLDLYPDMITAGLLFAKEHNDLAQIAMHLYRSTDNKIQELWKRLSENGIGLITELLKKDQHAGNIRNDVNVKIVAKILYQLNSVDVLEEYFKGNNETMILEIMNDSLNILTYGIRNEGKHESI